MEIKGSVVLVTGANRGIGAEWVRQLRERGAAKVYAGARDPQSVTPADGVVPIVLDVNNPAQVAAAAAQAGNVQIVVNDAGLMRGQLLDADPTQVREEFETNVFGLLSVAQALAPALKANGGGALVNALSAVSWFSLPGVANYSATKAAAWNLTDGLRIELQGQGTLVVGLHSGAVDTDMADGLPLDTVDAHQVVNAALNGLLNDQTEVLADNIRGIVKSTLTSDPSRYSALLAG